MVIRTYGETMDSIVRILRSDGPLTAGEITDLLLEREDYDPRRTSRASVENHLSRLSERGIVEKCGIKWVSLHHQAPLWRARDGIAA